MQELGEAFQSENTDRLSVLRDASRIPAPLQSLLAALVSARLQARRVMLDIQDFQAASPTIYWVVPCVTINRPAKDTEIVCGFYSADRRSQDPRDEYCGLGDDPSTYRVHRLVDSYTVEDLSPTTPRAARDHRQLVQDRWRMQAPASLPRDGRLERIQNDVVRDRHHNHRHAKMLLRLALPVLAEVAPIPAAIFLFAQGLIGIQHTYRAHRLASEIASTGEARQLLEELHTKIDRLEPGKAQAVLEHLVHEYGTS